MDGKDDEDSQRLVERRTSNFDYKNRFCKRLISLIGEITSSSMSNSSVENDDIYCQISSSTDGLILDSSYAYISNNPVGIQLIRGNQNYKLKVNQWC